VLTTTQQDFFMSLLTIATLKLLTILICTAGIILTLRKHLKVQPARQPPANLNLIETIKQQQAELQIKINSPFTTIEQRKSIKTLLMPFQKLLQT
jgi:hypothetical protein